MKSNIFIINQNLSFGNPDVAERLLEQIIFPDGLVTNLNKKLDLKGNTDGIARIILKEERLLQKIVSR